MFSSTLARAPWGSWPEANIVRGDIAEEIAKLRKEPGKDILLAGSISLAQGLIRKASIDEYRLVLCPTTLGSGRMLFPEDASTLLKLRSATMLERGGVSLIYDRIDGTG